jgi:hypothetical protein
VQSTATAQNTAGSPPTSTRAGAATSRETAPPAPYADLPVPLMILGRQCCVFARDGCTPGQRRLRQKRIGGSV